MEKNIEDLKNEYNYLLKAILGNIKDLKSQICLIKQKNLFIEKIKEIDLKIEKIINNYENKL